MKPRGEFTTFSTLKVERRYYSVYEQAVYQVPGMMYYTTRLLDTKRKPPPVIKTPN